MRTLAWCSAAALVGLGVAASAQRGGMFSESRDHPAILYTTRTPTDDVTALARRVERGEVTLAFDQDHGYLRSALDALGVPLESQVTVFTETSLQGHQVSPSNPRALFFNDRVSVGWVRDGGALELAALDREQGVIFYTIEQKPSARPRFLREETCLTCHLSADTLGVPGLLVYSVFSIPQDQYSYAGGFMTDHRSPLEERWGGWFVTGRAGSARHLGNTEVPQTLRVPGERHGVPRQLDSLEGLFDPRGYLSLHSDVVALMVLEHQAHMTNLLIRLGWEARVSASGLGGARGMKERLPGAGAPASGPGGTRVDEAVRDLVDYLLFVDEAPIAGPIRGTSGFAGQFTGSGPRDANGRSLRQLDLQRRLLRYPCSFMIYSEAFDRLPEGAKAAVYERMWAILSGKERGAPYDRLSPPDRRAIVEILQGTKQGLPAYFTAEDVR